MTEFMTWRIVLRAGMEAQMVGLPAAALTLAPRFRHESMPDEVSLLLPTNEGPQSLIAAVVKSPSLYKNTILGLFLGSPFLNVDLEGAKLAQAGVRWISNLPSVDQQDEEFLQQLSDVGLDRQRELSSLSQLSAQGFSIATVVADAAGAIAAAAIAPQAIIVLPRVADFAAGFPSLRQRGAAAQSVAEATRAAGWNGPLLGLAEASEAEHERLWPAPLAGVICRPTAL